MMRVASVSPDLPHPLPPQQVSGDRRHTADTQCPYLLNPDSVTHSYITHTQSFGVQDKWVTRM